MSFIGVYRMSGTGVVKISNPRESEADNIRFVAGTLNPEKRREYLRMKIYEQAILQMCGRDTAEAMQELLKEYFE